MTKTAPETYAEIELRAMDFSQRRRFWEWTDADQAELDAWLAESDFHQVTYLRLEAGADRLERLIALRPPEQNVPRERGRNRRFVLSFLIAASVASLVALGIPLARHLMEPPVRVFTTNVGGQALLKFTDGTQIELNTDTSVRYRMTTQERTVWLDKGEAYFRVAHNAADPFIVVARGHRITDLGTEFLVRDDAGGLDVVLVKGRAQLASENAGVPVAMLAPGEEAVASRAATTITKKTQQELSDQLAWRRGVLVFRKTRLSDAVREFNRYNETKLVIADPAISRLKFGGEVRTGNIEDFLDLAQTVLKLGIERNNNVILLYRTAGEAERAVNIKRNP